MVGLRKLKYLLWVPWVWDSYGDSNGDSCGYLMGMGIEMPSPRQPWIFYTPITRS